MGLFVFWLKRGGNFPPAKASNMAASSKNEKKRLQLKGQGEKNIKECQEIEYLNIKWTYLGALSAHTKVASTGCLL